MTIIEFFDKNSIENIAGALLCRPERVVFVGDKRTMIEKSMQVYSRILGEKGISSELIYKAVNKNVLRETVSALEGLLNTYGDCVFDVSGGEELYLVALGILMERYGNRVQCHRFNFTSGKISDIDADGTVAKTEGSEISVEDNINIYGGVITGSLDANEYLDGEFADDLENMWRICRNNAREWNAHTASMGAFLERLGLSGSLFVSFDRGLAEQVLEGTRIKFAFVNRIMLDLQKYGLIIAFSSGNRVSFAFKNHRVRKCLTVAGQVLELIVTSRLRGLKNKKGKYLYNDIKTGVGIDWDGCDENDEVRTLNEIDVIAMQGLTPIFISCKNGDFDMEELYKLNTVSERFGGKYAKKVLITTELEKLSNKEHLKARIEDMGIICIENADEMSDDEFEMALKGI